MTKTNVKVSVPLEEYNELINYKRIAEKLADYVDKLGTSINSTGVISSKFKKGDRVRIVGADWGGNDSYIGVSGVIESSIDSEGDYDVILDYDTASIPQSSLELI